MSSFQLCYCPAASKTFSRSILAPTYQVRSNVQQKNKIEEKSFSPLRKETQPAAKLPLPMQKRRQREREDKEVRRIKVFVFRSEGEGRMKGGAVYGNEVAQSAVATWPVRRESIRPS